MCMDDFLEARLKDDTDLPVDDVLTKHQIISVFRVLDSTFTMDRDAWLIVGEILRLFCLRYKDHPDYNEAWKPRLANDITTPQRVALGADQPAVTQ